MIAISENLLVFNEQLYDENVRETQRIILNDNNMPLSNEEKQKINEEEKIRAKAQNKYKSRPLVLAFVIVIIVILIVIGLSSTKNNTNETSTSNQEENSNQQVEEVATEFVEIFSLSGDGNRDSESFNTTGGNIKMVAITSGSTAVGSYSSISLESESDEYLSGARLSISTDGSESGNGETIIRNVDAGSYYISVISGIDWEVTVYELK